MSESGTMDGGRVALPGWLMRLTRVFAGIGGLSILAIMLVTVASVTLRGVLGRPIPFASSSLTAVSISALWAANFLYWASGMTCRWRSFELIQFCWSNAGAISARSR